MSNAEWFFRTSGWATDENHGPHSAMEMADLARAGQILRETLVRHPRETLGQWTAAETVNRLRLAIEAGEAEREANRFQAEEERKAEKQRIAAAKEVDRAERARIAALAKEERQRREHQAVLAANAPRPSGIVYVPDGRTGQMVAAPIFLPQEQKDGNNIAAVVINLFFPGVGQMIQGRVGVGLALFIIYLASVLSIGCFVGLIAAPVIWLAALIDAAIYRP